MELFYYLAKATSIIAFGYLLYYFLFRKFTFFTANRTYLIGLILTSIFLPLMEFKVTRQLPMLVNTSLPIAEGKAFNEISTSGVPIAGPSFHWIPLIQAIYLFCCFAILAKTIYSIIILVKNARLDGHRNGKFIIIPQRDRPIASFFNLIFFEPSILGNEERRQIMAHEEAHFSLFHSADKLLIEIVKAFFWFNPFVYLISNALDEVHEYQVDHALAQRLDKKNYAGLILKMAVVGNTPGLMNAFSAFKVQNRLSMLFAPKSSQNKKMLYLLVLPFLAIFFYAFTITPVYKSGSGNKPFVLVLDAGHGGKESGAIGIGGVREKDLNLQLVKIMESEALKAGMKVILTRETDATINFRNRLVKEGNAYISIHFNSVLENQADKHGSEVLVNKNSAGSVAFGGYLRTALEGVPELNKGQNVMGYQTGMAYVLRENTLPAVILEIGYLSNAHDLNYLSIKANQQLIATKLVEAVNAYRH